MRGLFAWGISGALVIATLVGPSLSKIGPVAQAAQDQNPKRKSFNGRIESVLQRDNGTALVRMINDAGEELTVEVPAAMQATITVMFLDQGKPQKWTVEYLPTGGKNNVNKVKAATRM